MKALGMIETRGLVAAIEAADAMGRDYALLNQLRAAVRETEVAAVEAFWENNQCGRRDIVEELNRLSSAMASSTSVLSAMLSFLNTK